MNRVLLGALGVAGAAAGGWTVFAGLQGNAEFAFEEQTLSGVVVRDRVVHGEITVTNRGRQGGVLHRFEGRILEGPPGRVLVTRKGSRPPHAGWWVSNCLKPGESCVAEVDIELREPGTGPVVIELDAHEIGRKLVVHRTLRIPLVLPAPQPAATPQGA